MAEEVVARAVGAFMARDLDGILELADPRIELRSLLTEAERPLYHGHDGVRAWFDAVFGVFPDWRPHPRPASYDEGGAVVIGLDVTATGARERCADRPDVLAGRPGASWQDHLLRLLQNRARCHRGDDMIPPDTSIGKVRLRVADLDDLTTFYERVIGLQAVEREGDVARLGAAGGEPVIELVGAPDAPPPPSFSTGLFHLAILVPDRAELARSLQRVGGAGWRLTGASDHLVSEALYLQDPEGNGIEIYRDRPREEWRRNGDELAMATLPLDLESVLGELDPGEREANGMPAGTTMGHVHLQVADIPAAERFYNRALGLDVMVRSYPGALFLAAGGYHHHIGLNTWQSQGAPPPPERSLGLDRYELVLPNAAERDSAADRLAEAGADPERLDEGVVAADPSGNRVLLTARES
jgi:catechol 2,3-dioxygenase